MPVDLRSLVDAYASNEVAANQKYQNKYLTFDCDVLAIRQDSQTVAVSLTSHTLLPAHDVECKDVDASQAVNLNPGQPVNVVGLFAGKDKTLTNCKIR